ncbi:MAG: AmmeMemoRadiSam system protein B [Deltaproteobacteria bacterium]|nr:AmmeMemoRadiSam system protein B [Deltaproteobacteria bacterium]
MRRQSAVAGQFYSGGAAELRRDLAELIPVTADKRRVTGIIAPHAGFIYSGAGAGRLYSGIEIPAAVLIIGPNHRGIGAAAALHPAGEWLTPLGPVPVDARLNALLQQHVPFVQSDSVAHQHEHSLEVQLPFIQLLRPDVAIAAICLGQGDYPAVRRIGEGIAAAIREFGSEVLIVASSDMTHYESADAARRKDELALARVLALDPEGLLDVCRNERITMCGAVPSAVMLVAARELGAGSAELVAYATSGDVSGDRRQVVGYAAVTVR